MISTVLELRSVVQSAICNSVFAPMSGGYEQAESLLRSIEALRRDIGVTTKCMGQRLEGEPKSLPKGQADLRETFDSELLRLRSVLRAAIASVHALPKSGRVVADAGDLLQSVEAFLLIRKQLFGAIVGLKPEIKKELMRKARAFNIPHCSTMRRAQLFWVVEAALYCTVNAAKASLDNEPAVESTPHEYKWPEDRTPIAARSQANFRS
jgi:hypothetical protein